MRSFESVLKSENKSLDDKIIQIKVQGVKPQQKSPIVSALFPLHDCNNFKLLSKNNEQKQYNLSP